MAEEKAGPSGSRDPGLARAAYRERLANYRKLLDEGVHTLNRALEARGLQHHSLVSRLKSETSFVEKAARKEAKDPFDEIHDIAA